MWVLLPRPGGDPVELLMPESLAAVGGAFTRTYVDLGLPRWDFATAIDLTNMLPDLGLRDVFGKGDFSGIAAGAGGISTAIHHATIAVDEAGTEAAAATALMIPLSMRPPPTVTVRCDRPFAFTVVGGPERVPLFTGVVYDPTASST